MRDLVILAILFGGSLWALRMPWVGAILWTWVSLASPHMSFAYGLSNYPVGQIVAGCTLVGLLMTQEKRHPFIAPSIWLLLAFVVWTTVTLPLSYHFQDSYELWMRSFKIFMMLFVTVALIDDKRKLDAFVWICVFSIGLYGFKGGLFTLATGGNYRVWGPGGFVQGNNELAVAILMTIPLIRYLQMQMSNRWARHGMTLWMVLSAVAVLGSHSRGALLGMGAIGFFLWLKGPKKAASAVGLLILAVLLLPLMPDAWWDRMNTIKTYQQDESANGRLDAWGFAWNLAKDKFPLGGGFMVWTKELFAIYAPWAQQNRAAHSIYFQILGEHGWLGLTLFMGLGWLAWRQAAGILRAVKGDAERRWAADLARMCQVSLIGFAVGGAFLSLAYFDLPYNVVAIVAMAGAMVKAQVLSAEGAPSTADLHASQMPHRQWLGHGTATARANTPPGWR